MVAKDPGTGRFDGGAHEQTVGSTHGVASFRQLFWPLQETEQYEFHVNVLDLSTSIRSAPLSACVVAQE